jgi:hypothetical protein
MFTNVGTYIGDHKFGLDSSLKLPCMLLNKLCCQIIFDAGEPLIILFRC